MTSWTVYSVAKLLFIQQVHTENPLKNIHGRKVRPRSRWRALYSAELNYDQKMLLQNSKKASVYQSSRRVWP